MAEKDKTDDELLEEMIAEEEAEKKDEKEPDIYDAVAEYREKHPELHPDADILGDAGTPQYGSGPGEDPGDDTPQIPTPEEAPVVPDAPASTTPAAVETTPAGKKFGWQQPPVRGVVPVEPCAHMAIVQARKQVPNQEINHTWVCTCGTEFIVTLNSSMKKILKQVE